VVKPELARDAYFAPVPDGVYWLTNRGPVTLTGRSIAEWIDRLAPFLDGQRSLAELVAHLPLDRGAFVSQIVRTLHEQGLVKDVSVRRTPQDAVIAPHAAQVHFIDYFVDSALVRFLRYRNRRTVMIGAGRSLVACVAAGLRSGMDMVTAVVVTDDCATDLGELTDVLAGSRRQPDERLLVGEPDPGWLEQLVDDATVVVHVSDRTVPARARLLTRICDRDGTLLVQAVMTGAEAWIAPSTGRAGWDDARLRLALPASPDGVVERVTADDAAIAVLADHVVHRVFREVTGANKPDDTRPRMARLDLATLHTTYHRVLPHPFAAAARPRTAEEFGDAMGRLVRGDRLDEETFSRRAAELVDDHVGPFRHIGERDFAQLPLHVSEVVVADSVGVLDGRGALVPVIAAGPDFAAARHRAALRAFAVHGSLFVDPRRLLAEDGTGELIGGGDPVADVAALAAGYLTGRVWGSRLTDGQPCEVPVEAAFPALRARSEPTAFTTGAAAGYDWNEAVTAGVVGRCLDVTVAELADASRPLSIVDVDRLALDESGQRYRGMLAAFDAAVTVYDATGSLGVPTFAFCLDARTVCHTSAPRVTDALRDGLEQVLLACQARVHGQSAYAPAPVPQLPSRLRGEGPAVERRDFGLRNLVEALCGSGRVPVAVPLDHDPEMSEVMPYVVQVVLR
jgi:hypothetical protein